MAKKKTKPAAQATPAPEAEPLEPETPKAVAETPTPPPKYHPPSLVRVLDRVAEDIAKHDEQPRESGQKPHKDKAVAYLRLAQDCMKKAGIA